MSSGLVVNRNANSRINFIFVGAFHHIFLSFRNFAGMKFYRCCGKPSIFYRN